ncbi:MAG: hypothetical protein ABI616_11400 [Pseudomonadota bacterium]
MSNKTPDKFSLRVPDEKEPARALPSKLEVIDYNPRTKQPHTNLPAGAYNPYDRERTEDKRKEKKKQVDLRQLSQWIQATQKVRILKLEDGMQGPDAPTQPRLPKLK